MFDYNIFNILIFIKFNLECMYIHWCLDKKKFNYNHYILYSNTINLSKIYL